MAEHTSLLAGGAGERRLSADEVRDTVFPPAGFARGLNTEQVTRFMHRVAAELDRCGDELADLQDEKADLQEKVLQLQKENDQLRAQTAPVNGHSGLPVEQQAVHMLRRAQENADGLLADAQRQAHDLMLNGRQTRERMLADGHAQRQRVITAAVEEAGQQAARIAAKAPIDAQRSLAQYEGLARAVQAGLRTYLQGLQAQVDAWSAQEQQGQVPLPPPPLPQRGPTGPQPTAPLG